MQFFPCYDNVSIFILFQNYIKYIKFIFYSEYL